MEGVGECMSGRGTGVYEWTREGVGECMSGEG